MAQSDRERSGCVADHRGIPGGGADLVKAKLSYTSLVAKASGGKSEGKGLLRVKLRRPMEEHMNRIALILVGIAIVSTSLIGCSGGVGVNVRTNIRLAENTVISVFNGIDGTVMEVWVNDQFGTNGLTPTAAPFAVRGRSFPNGFSSNVTITVKAFDANTGQYLGMATRSYRIGSYGGSNTWIVRRQEIRQ
ncbi:MAG: hypothetical protein A3A16_03810 [Candidatus Harrisonbacteria bacterium RIFCSPLOWO2_01_FULL_44_18]|uniref:Uncharacterized protein n=1 Tax=Candidatus Harrisonbacteria bacterium RIFCSPLOWO2_01_FULL_44_18 TaxID=1798407 RepID=A0A1G1ZM44_9BACT|nr:MAG: hypothetical protein A3A16_03810 [Candidatus Harrisonbacteria bacterium RIFCSPLOWO2_01_FULL_44_18]